MFKYEISTKCPYCNRKMTFSNEIWDEEHIANKERCPHCNREIVFILNLEVSLFYGNNAIVLANGGFFKQFAKGQR